ncbi:MAG: cytochrome c [Bacteroidales bacterium]
MKNIGLFFLSTAFLFSMFLLSCGGSENGSTGSSDSASVKTTENTSVANLDLTAGKKIFTEKCQVCHQETGLGVPGTFPPLAKSDYLQADKLRAVKQAIYGSKEPITVNGITYPGKIMTVFEKELTDQQVVDVVNYVLNSWGNQMGTVTLEDAKKARESNK